MACPLKASGSLHPTPVQMVPYKTFLYTEAKLDPIYTPDLGSGAETPSRQKRRCWRERCRGLDPILSLAAVAELICVIGSEVSIAPQVQLRENRKWLVREVGPAGTRRPRPLLQHLLGLLT